MADHPLYPKVLEALATCETETEIAKRLGCARSYVRCVASRNGVAKGRRGVPRGRMISAAVDPVTRRRLVETAQQMGVPTGVLVAQIIARVINQDLLGQVLGQ